MISKQYGGDPNEVNIKDKALKILVMVFHGIFRPGNERWKISQDTAGKK